MSIDMDTLLSALDERMEEYRLPKYLSTKAAAAVASVTPPTIRKWVNDGGLPAFWAGGAMRIRLADLEAYLGRKSPKNVIDMDARVREMMSNG